MTALATRQAPQLRTRGFAASAKAAALRPVPAAIPSVTASLDSVGTIVNHLRGKTVAEEGNPADYVYKVVSGALRKVRLLPDGRRHITSFLMPGDFFGFAEGRDYAHTVEAVADVTLVRYARRGFEAMLEQDPRAGRHFLGLVCRALSATQEQLLLLGRKSALERMATFLLAMADKAGHSGADTQFDLPMNRSDVADYLGLTIETVSRLITRLRAMRIIDTPDAHSILILKRDALEDISAGEA